MSQPCTEPDGDEVEPRPIEFPEPYPDPIEMGYPY